MLEKRLQHYFLSGFGSTEGNLLWKAKPLSCKLHEFNFREVFSYPMPFFDVSPPSPSQPAAPNTQGCAGEQLVPARSTQRGPAGTHLPDTSRLPARAGALFQLFPPGDLADLTQALACHFPAPGFCSQFLLSEVSSEELGCERDAGGMLQCGAGKKSVHGPWEGPKVLRYPYTQEGLCLCVSRIYLKRIKPAQRELQM